MKKKIYYIVVCLLCLISIRVYSQNDYKVTILNDGEEVDLSDVRFYTAKGNGLYAIIGNSLIGMDEERNGDLVEMSIPDSTYIIDEVVILPSLLVCKSDSDILYINERKRLKGYSIDTDNFSIRYASDSTIYILVGDKVFESNPLRGKPKLQFEYTNHKIIEYMPVGNDVYVATDKQLLLKSKEQLVLLLSMPEPITAINISSHGILIGTMSALFKYNSVGTLQLIDEIPVSQILNDEEFLYIVTYDSSIYRLQRQKEEKSPAKSKKKTKSKNR